MNKKITLGIILLSTQLGMSTAYAQRASISAHVTRVLVSDAGTYGGCMALIDKVIATQSSAANTCPSRWVSFSCDGTYNSKDIAYRKLDIAQKSEVTGHAAVFYVDDLKKHNGYCYAYRVDSLSSQ